MSGDPEDHDEMVAFAKEHGLPATLDHMRYIGLANIAHDYARRAVDAERRVAELERALAVVPHFQKMWVALPEDVKLILDAREGLPVPRRRWWRLFKQAPTPAKPPSGEGQSVPH